LEADIILNRARTLTTWGATDDPCAPYPTRLGCQTKNNFSADKKYKTKVERYSHVCDLKSIFYSQQQGIGGTQAASIGVSGEELDVYRGGQVSAKGSRWSSN